MESMKIERREQVNIYRKRRGDQAARRFRAACVVKYLALTIAGILLFRAGQAIALIERGYAALGGEGFALFLPVFSFLISRTVQDIIKDWPPRTQAKTEAGEERQNSRMELFKL